MIKYFKLQLDFKVAIRDYEPTGDIYDANERCIRIFLKEFLENRESVLAFYKESLSSMFNWGNENSDTINELLNVVKNDGNHFFPPALKCPPDVKDFILHTYSDLPSKDMSDNDRESVQQKIQDRLGELRVVSADFYEVPPPPQDSNNDQPG